MQMATKQRFQTSRFIHHIRHVYGVLRGDTPLTEVNKAESVKKRSFQLRSQTQPAPRVMASRKRVRYNLQLSFVSDAERQSFSERVERVRSRLGGTQQLSNNEFLSHLLDLAERDPIAGDPSIEAPRLMNENSEGAENICYLE